MKTERKLILAGLAAMAMYILVTDPELIEEVLQVIKIERDPGSKRPDTVPG